MGCMKEDKLMFGIAPFERRNPDFFDPFDDFFGRRPALPTFGSFKTDVRDEGDKYILEAELPGFEKNEIKLDVLGDMLTLSAEHCTETKEGADKENKEEAKPPRYIRRERSCCSLKRSFDLTGVDTDKISAEYKNGILYMELPKKQPDVPQTRRLEIR